MSSKSSHDIEIDGKGYVLQDGSYIQRPQEPFNPRFSTGDPQIGDLSFWQWLSQEDWAGGAGQEDFSVINKYKKAFGWETKNGKPRLAPSIQVNNAGGIIPAPEVSDEPTLFDDFSAGSSKWVASDPSTAPIIAFVGAESLDGSLFSAPANYAHGVRGVAGTLTDFWEALQTKSEGKWKITWTAHRSDGAGIPAILDTNFWQIMFILDDVADNGYRVRIFGPSGDSVSLVRIDAGSDVVLATNVGAATFPAGATTAGKIQDQTVEVSRDSAGEFKVTVNGTLRITHTDTTHNTSTVMRLFPMETGSETPILPHGGPTWPTATIGITAVHVPADSELTRALQGKMIAWENELLSIYPDAGTAFDFTIFQDPDFTNKIPRIRHINASDAVLWTRASGVSGDKDAGVYLLATKGNTLRVFNGLTLENEPSTTLSFIPTALLPIDGNHAIFMGTSTGYSGDNWLGRLKYGTGDFIPVLQEQKIDVLVGKNGTIVNSAALDANGTAYFAFTDVDPDQGIHQTKIFRLTASDITAANTRISEIQPLDDFVVRGIQSIAGLVYYFGFKVDGDLFIPAIMRATGEIIWESDLKIDTTTAADAEIFNAGILSAFKTDRGVVFISNMQGVNGTSVFRLNPDESVVNLGVFEDFQFTADKPTIPAIASNYGRAIILAPREQDIGFQKSGRGAFSKIISSPLVISSSKFGANTPLIDKSLNMVKIELSEKLTVDCPLTIKVNGIVIGTMDSKDDLVKELFTKKAITGISFQLEIEAPRTGTWPGQINRNAIQYIPSQLDKLAWGFAIRAGNQLKLKDGTRESRRGTELLADIREAKQSKRPLKFIDIDDTEHSVIVTNYSANAPLVSSNSPKLNMSPAGQEFIIAVELLEA